MDGLNSKDLLMLKQAIGNKYAKSESECSPVYVFQNMECLQRFQRIWIQDGSPEMAKRPFIVDDLFHQLNSNKEEFPHIPEDYSPFPKSPVIMFYDNIEAVEIKKFEQAIRDEGIDIYLQKFDQADRIIYDTNPEVIKREIDRQYSEVYSGKAYMDEFLESIEDEDKNKPISTGFELFDQALDGGIYPDLYCLGGGTGSGKTTFVLNMITNMARDGEDVLMIALEMSRKELFAKMISSLSYYRCVYNKIKPERYYQSTRNILRGGKDNESKEDRFIRESSIREFKDSIVQNIYIEESIGKCTVKSIDQAIENHVRHTGKKPIVFIDYLQILSHTDKYIRANDKVKTDDNILELKRLSRDYGIPIFIISSLNRESYKDLTQEVNLTSFKESGAIEFSCAVVLGLQLAKVTDIALAKRKAKSKSDQVVKELEAELLDAIEENPKLMDIKILKNRHDGNKGIIRFSFHGECNRYIEVSKVNTKRSSDEIKQAKKADLESFD